MELAPCSYYDYLGVLPALVPEGPLLILGTGAGTIARMIHAFFPERVMHGWELDGVVIEAACSYLGMQDLLDKGALVSCTLPVPLLPCASAAETGCHVSLNVGHYIGRCLLTLGNVLDIAGVTCR